MRTIQKLIFGLVAILAFASCDNKDNSLANVIPKDVVSVIYFDTKSLASKSEFDLFKNAKIKEALADAPINDKQKEILDAVQKDVNALGLNLKGNAYMFFNLNYYGIVLEVNNRTKFENNLKQIIDKSSFEELTKGVSTFAIPFVGSMAWDDKKIVLMWKNYNGSINVDEKLVEIFTQKKENSIASLQTFQDFNKNLKDISMYGAGIAAYSELLTQMGISLNPMQNEALNDLSGAKSISNISFDKGEIKMDASSVFDNKESEEKYMSFVNTLVQPLDSKMLDYIPSKTIVTAGMGVNGANLFNKLSDLNILTAANVGDEELYLNIKEILSNLENTVVSLNSIKPTLVDKYDYKYYDYMPQATLLATQKNGTDVFGLLKEKISEKVSEMNSYGFETGMKIETVSPNAFTFVNNETNITFGLVDNILYISNDEDFSKNMAEGKKYNHDIKLPSSVVSVMYGNLQQLSSIPSEGYGAKDIKMLQQLNVFDTYEFIVPTMNQGSGSIKLIDKNKNSLATICETINSFITEKMSY